MKKIVYNKSINYYYLLWINFLWKIYLWDIIIYLNYILIKNINEKYFPNIKYLVDIINNYFEDIYYIFIKDKYI